MNKVVFDPRDDEEKIETRLSCALIFYVSLAEFEEIKQKLKTHLEKLVYQKINADPLWVVPKKEAEKLDM